MEEISKEWDQFIEFFTIVQKVALECNVTVDEMMEVYKVMKHQEYFSYMPDVKQAALSIINVLAGFEEFKTND